MFCGNGINFYKINIFVFSRISGFHFRNFLFILFKLVFFLNFYTKKTNIFKQAKKILTTTMDGNDIGTLSSFKMLKEEEKKMLTPQAGPAAAENEKSLKAKIKTLIAGLAYDIRGDWSVNTRYRVKLMIELCQKIGAKTWAEQLQANLEEIIEDGRWMRDEWIGPYGCPSQEIFMCDSFYGKYLDCFQFPEFFFTEKQS